MGYSKYPGELDDTISLPLSTDSVTEVRAIIINQQRDAIVKIESTLGTTPNGTFGTVRDRIQSIETQVGNLTDIKLTGDLGGTSNVPKVIGLQGRSILDTTPPTSGDVLTFNGTEWFYLPFGGSSINPIGPAGGDLGGTYPNPSVVNIQGIEVSTTTPLDGYSLVYELSSDMWIPARVSTDPATTISLGTIQLAGDLGGTSASPSVLKIRGATIPAAGALTTGNGLYVSGVSALSYSSLNLAGGANYVSGVLPVLNGGNYINQLSFLFFAGVTNTSSITFVVGGTLILNRGLLSSSNTKTIKLRVVAETTGPLCSIQLYNLTTAAVVTGSSLSTSSTSPVVLTTGDLYANLSSGLAVYQIQMNMGAGSISDRVNLDFAELLVEWS